ncbi:hypothetical protein VNI00_014060 [Paramarasmius palmivorus]|uniref:Glycoside hydrolase family 105 protein n=1 Tax=Paramarasmius palmivorus TaxID=297713 RepID=A0AAW0BUN9_9AGAR
MTLLSLLSLSLLITHVTSSSNYSLQMASSTIARQQGILTGTGGSSELLQAGITQKAFTQLVRQYPSLPSTSTYATYITTSINSTVSTVSDAQKDTTYPLDRFSVGNGLMNAYTTSGDGEYQNAYEALVQSISLQPRNAEGGLWYYVYPNWSYLDGMYSFAPFYTSYALSYSNDQPNVTSIVHDVVYQFNLLWAHCYDNQTGLLFHGYDATKSAVWANPNTGASAYVWGRSLGWYVMGLVDTLELLPYPIADLKLKFTLLADALVRHVDGASGGWWQVLNEPGREGNYIESSATAMFVYALFKGSRLGYLQPETRYTEVANRAYEMLVERFVVRNEDGTLGYNGTVAVCSLNSTASYEYYIGQPLLYNSALGTGAFVLASLEYERFHAGDA